MYILCIRNTCEGITTTERQTGEGTCYVSCKECFGNTAQTVCICIWVLHYYFLIFFIFFIIITLLFLFTLSVKSKLQHTLYPSRVSGTIAVPEEESLPGMRNLILMHRGWGIWNMSSISCEISVLWGELIVRPFAEALFKMERTSEGKVLASWAIGSGVQRSTQAVFGGGIYLLLLFLFLWFLHWIYGLNTLCLQLQYNRYQRSNLCDDLICRCNECM